MRNNNASTTFDIEGLGDTMAHPDMKLKLTYSSLDHNDNEQNGVPPAYAVANLITLVPDTTNATGMFVLDELKNTGIMQDYQPGDGTFRDHVTQTISAITVPCSWISRDGDHITYELYMTMKNLLLLDEVSLDGWSIEACLNKS